MGIKLFSGGSKKHSGSMAFSGCMKYGSDSTEYTPKSETTPNPNKFRFKIVGIRYGVDFDVVQVHYPDCTTFEGMKLLLTEKGFASALMTDLDPHLLENHGVVARFRPTDEGWTMACDIAQAER